MTTQVACPHCLALNRVPSERLADKPRCGKCKQALFAGQPINATDANFDQLALKTDLPVVIDFWADWCGPCQQFAPTFAATAQKLEPRARFIKVNTEQAQQLGMRFGIRSIPTLLVLKNGQEVGRQAGAMPGHMFEQWVGQYLG